MNIHDYIEKLASTKARKNIVSFLRERGFNKKTLKNASPTKLQKMLNSAGAPKDLLESAAEEVNVRGQFPDLIKRTANSKMSPSERAMFREDAKRRWSGYHKPKKGEEFIESFGTPEVAMGAPSKKYLYRGNPIDISIDDYHPNPQVRTRFLSKYPDIAAGYAAQGTQQVTSKTNKLYRYSPKEGIKELSATGAAVAPHSVPSGVKRVTLPSGERVKKYRTASSYMKELSSKQSQKPRDVPNIVQSSRLYGKGYVKKIADKPTIRKSYEYNPNYETVLIPEGKAKRLLGKPEEFSVRKSRTSDGRIGFAIKKVSK